MENTHRQKDVKVQVVIDSQSDLNNQRYIFLDTPFCEEKLYIVSSEQIKQPLHKNVVAIIWRDKIRVTKNSGILISKNMVLTSAEPLYYKGIRVNQKGFEVYVGETGLLTKQYTVQKYFVPKQYSLSSPKYPKYNFALLKLNENVQSDSFIKIECDFKDLTADIAIFGYPQKYYRFNKQKFEQQASQAGLIRKGNYSTDITDGSILYSLSAMKGQNGSPIVAINQEQLRIIGVNLGGISQNLQSSQAEKNIGSLFTLQARSFFQEHVSIYKDQIKLESQEVSIVQKPVQLKLKNQTSFRSFSEQNPVQTISKLKKQILINPLNVELYLRLGQAHHNLKFYEEAINHYEQVLLLDSNSDQAYYKMGLTYFAIQKKQEAIIYFKKAISINPLEQDYFLAMATVSNQIKQYNSTINILKTIQCDTQNDQIFYEIAIAHYELGQYDKTVQYSQKALSLNDNEKYYKLLGDAYLYKKQYNQAIQCFKKGLILNPQHPYLIHDLGNAYSEVNKYQLALQCYQKARLMDSNNATIWNGIGKLYYDKKQYGKAKLYFNKSLQINPNYAESINDLGIVYFVLEDDQEAMKLYKKAIEIRPKYFDAINNIGILYLRQNKYQKAIEYAQKSIQLNPKFQPGYLCKTNACIQLKQYQIAKECLQELVKINPTKRSYRVDLKALKKDIKKFKEKKFNFQK